MGHSSTRPTRLRCLRRLQCLRESEHAYARFSGEPPPGERFERPCQRARSDAEVIAERHLRLSAVNWRELPSSGERLEHSWSPSHLHGRDPRWNEGDILRLHSNARARDAPCANTDSRRGCTVEECRLPKERIPGQATRVVLREGKHGIRTSVDDCGVFEPHRVGVSVRSPSNDLAAAGRSKARAAVRCEPMLCDITVHGTCSFR
jgi:hypothetical protein